MTVDFFGGCSTVCILELMPRPVPLAAARPSAVDTEVDMLGDEQGELMDVWHPLSMEPHPEILGLGKDVVPHPPARGKSGR